jgi:DNA-3-methyladenine glycosylase II
MMIVHCNSMGKIQPIVNKTDTAKLLALHPVFHHIHSLYGLPPNWSRPPGFDSLCKIILEQQVSLSSAQAHYNKLLQYVGAMEPQRMLQLSATEMRECQISRQKGSYLQALAQAIVSETLKLQALQLMPEAAVREQLMRIKGIGNWTTDIYLMFCMQAKDIFPLGDIAVINTVRELTSAHTPAEIEALSQQWRPYRSLAAFFCWHYYLCKRGRSN